MRQRPLLGAQVAQRWDHTVKLMVPHFVKPYMKTNKNDMNDAEAMWEALQRPNIRFVAIKTIEQQSILHLHVSSWRPLTRRRVA